MSILSRGGAKHMERVCNGPNRKTGLGVFGGNYDCTVKRWTIRRSPEAGTAWGGLQRAPRRLSWPRRAGLHVQIVLTGQHKLELAIKKNWLKVFTRYSAQIISGRGPCSRQWHCQSATGSWEGVAMARAACPRRRTAAGPRDSPYTGSMQAARGRQAGNGLVVR